MPNRFLFLRSIVLCVLLSIVTACGPQALPTTEPVSTLTSGQSVPSPSASAETVLYRGNALRTGVYDLPAMRNLPEVKWQAEDELHVADAAHASR